MAGLLVCFEARRLGCATPQSRSDQAVQGSSPFHEDDEPLHLCHVLSQFRTEGCGEGTEPDRFTLFR
jgi:hypothetical protein